YSPKPTSHPARAIAMSQAVAEPARRSGKPANMSWACPYLVVRDAAKAVAFYEAAFGFGKQNIIPGPDGQVAHAEVIWNGCVIMMGAERQGAPGKAPITTGTVPSVSMYVYCDDVDALHARATAAGADS